MWCLWVAYCVSNKRSKISQVRMRCSAKQADEVGTNHSPYFRPAPWGKVVEKLDLGTNFQAVKVGSTLCFVKKSHRWEENLPHHYSKQVFYVPWWEPMGNKHPVLHVCCDGNFVQGYFSAGIYFSRLTWVLIHKVVSRLVASSVHCSKSQELQIPVVCTNTTSVVLIVTSLEPSGVSF